LQLLDSLCFAILLMRLEDEIGVNPFCVDGAILPSTTVVITGCLSYPPRVNRGGGANGGIGLVGRGVAVV
jgi:hypothetical protein